ncbi:histone acetyltransferase p300-like isoform X2 [Pogonomyrmex barbatus]|uniref:histone acetyltransferase n=1 Tax=Pogonomyrmex barbatus TaxID=144034 RepID=A0A6I9WKL5_9HYME|nr:histone acetyltransferase p300-like isoform X2 [Pogonomyrmex barbatus]
MSSMQATAMNVVGGQEDETAAQQAQPPVPNPAQSSVPIGKQQGPQQATQGQMTSTGAPTDCTKFTPDSEKCRFIQEYLVFLLHADKCQRRENQANEMERCTLSRCKTMKKVLKHTTNCTRGKNGFVSSCSMSKSIINHWKYCNRSDCPICMPIKNQQRIGKDNFMDSMFNINTRTLAWPRH